MEEAGVICCTRRVSHTFMSPGGKSDQEPLVADDARFGSSRDTDIRDPAHDTTMEVLV
jgi:hypothetical protein